MPLVFCLMLYQHCLHLRLKFQSIYLDDVALGGDCTDLVHDIELMRNVADEGLNLNARKCEIISSNMTSCGTLY